MRTTLALTLFAMVLTTQAEARNTFCKTLLAQAQTMLTRQTDDDLEGIIRVPKGIAKKDRKLYVALLERARYHLELYQDSSQVLDILDDQCADAFRIRKHYPPYTCGEF